MLQSAQTWPVGTPLRQLLCALDRGTVSLPVLSCFLAQDGSHWSCAFLAPDLGSAMSPGSSCLLYFFSSCFLWNPRFCCAQPPPWSSGFIHTVLPSISSTLMTALPHSCVRVIHFFHWMKCLWCVGCCVLKAQKQRDHWPYPQEAHALKLLARWLGSLPSK